MAKILPDMRFPRYHRGIIFGQNSQNGPKMSKKCFKLSYRHVELHRKDVFTV